MYMVRLLASGLTSYSNRYPCEPRAVGRLQTCSQTADSLQVNEGNPCVASHFITMIIVALLIWYLVVVSRENSITLACPWVSP